MQGVFGLPSLPPGEIRLTPPERGTTDLFLGVAAMYLLVPAFAFAAVQAASAAAALPFSGGLPPAAGSPPLPGLRLMK